MPKQKDTATTVLKLEFGPLPLSKRGNTRKRKEEEFIEQRAWYFHEIGATLRTAPQIAVAEYDDILQSFRAVKIPGVDRERLYARLTEQWGNDFRTTARKYALRGERTHDDDGLQTIFNLRRASKDDPRVLRIYKSMRRKQLKTETP